MIKRRLTKRQRVQREVIEELAQKHDIHRYSVPLTKLEAMVRRMVKRRMGRRRTKHRANR